MIKMRFDNKPCFIYENMNEFRASIHKDKLKPYTEAAVGDYVETDNGFYIPLLSYRDSTFKSRIYGLIVRRLLIFPYYTFRYALNDQHTHKRRRMVYKHSITGLSNNRYLSAHEAMVLKLMEQGFTLYQAVKHVYPNKHFHRLLKVLSNPKFINRLKGLAMSLKDSIESQGINNEYIAQKIKDIFESDKPNATLIKYALETSIELLKSSPSTSTIQSGDKSLVGEIRSELRSTMVN